MAAEVPTKQKATIGIIVVVLLILVWQVMGLFRGGSSKAPTITPAQSGTPASNPSSGISASASGPAATMAQPQSQISQISLQHDVEFIKMQQEIQKKYLDFINQLQLLRLQKEIAEANQAITTSNLATATAEKNIADLVTQSASTSAPATTSATLAANLPPAPPSSEDEAAAAKAAQAKADDHYAVVSVAMQFDKWTAIVTYKGKLYSVNVNDILPDGSKVLKISNDGVLIEKDSKQTMISLTSAV